MQQRAECLVEIQEVYSERLVDIMPDFSHYGRFTNKPEYGAIDRQARGECHEGEYRYFKPAVDEGEPNYDSTLTHEEREKYRMQDYERVQALCRDQWCFMGVKATARIRLSFDEGKTWMGFDFQSPGLWGIESDSGDDYFKEIEDEQLHELKLYLHGFKLDPSAIEESINKAEHRTL